MVDLVEACKKVGAREGEVVQQNQEDQTKDFWTVMTNGIMLGTLWCGVDDIAETYTQASTGRYVFTLSQFAPCKVDSCCRAHDHCPVKVKAFQSRYAVILAPVCHNSI